jgi:hypothetical protein
MNEGDGKLTLHNNVLTRPEIVREVEEFGINRRRILPALPLCPISAEIPRVTEAVRTISLV